MTNLKKARKAGKIDTFIAEHETDTNGDLDKLDEVIRMEIPAGLKVVGLTKHDLFSAITQFRAQTREAK